MIEVTLVYLTFRNGLLHHSFTHYADQFDVDIWMAINHKFLEDHDVRGVEFENLMVTGKDAEEMVAR